MAASSSFSYAQAAKGHPVGPGPLPSATENPAPTNSVASSLNSDAVDIPTTQSAARVEVEHIGGMGDGESASTIATNSDAKTQSLSAMIAEASTQSSASQMPEYDLQSRTAIEKSAAPEAEDTTAVAHVSHEPDDYQDDSRVEKLDESDLSAHDAYLPETPSDTTATKELAFRHEISDAPIPAVNVWHQRKVAMAFKAKSAPPSAEKSTTPGDSWLPTSTERKPKPFELKQTSKIPVDSDPLGGSNLPASTSGNKQYRKSTDLTRPSNDSTRVGPVKGVRPEKDAQPLSVTIPSRVEDAESWPTPDSATLKPKAADKVGPETMPAKSKQKDRTWVTMPYVPSVTFNTPLPQRGSRGRGGGRGGRDSTFRGSYSNTFGPASSSLSTEKITAATKSSPDVRDPPRDGAEPPIHAPSLPLALSKRSPTDTQSAREPRKASGMALVDRSKPTVNSSAVSAESLQTGTGSDRLESREGRIEGRNETRAHDSRADYRVEGNSDRRLDGRPHGRSDNRVDGRPEGRSAEYNRTEARNDSRPERGRGGHRGRGGYHHSSHAQTSNASSALSAATFVPRSSAPASASASTTASANLNPLQYPLTARPFVPGYAQGSTHGISSSSASRGRGGHRVHAPAASAANSHLTSPPSNGVNARIPAPPTHYDYSDQHLSASLPYPQLLVDPTVYQMLKTQIEYYFSVENLCKDIFLKEQMDAQGFVFLAVIASFKRIRELTDSIDVIRLVCEESVDIDYVIGDDGFERLRRSQDWFKFVPITRREGPNRVQGPNELFFRSRPPMMSPFIGYGVSQLPVGYTNGADQGYRPPISIDTSPQVMMNGHVFSNGYLPSESHLSAAVPEFSPAGMANPTAVYDGTYAATYMTNGTDRYMNGDFGVYAGTRMHQANGIGHDDAYHLTMNGAEDVARKSAQQQSSLPSEINNS